MDPFEKVVQPIPGKMQLHKTFTFGLHMISGAHRCSKSHHVLLVNTLNLKKKNAQSKSRNMASELQGKNKFRLIERLMNAEVLSMFCKQRRKMFVKGWETLSRKWKSELGTLRRDIQGKEGGKHAPTQRQNYREFGRIQNPSPITHYINKRDLQFTEFGNYSTHYHPLRCLTGG